MVVERSTVGLRVDVDTRRGLDEGVPRLLALFRRLDIRASFFVTMGPDHSGRAIRRALRPSFLAKMWRTNPFKLYGLRTLLSGTLAPARLVGAGAPSMLRQIADEGHEVAPHGWDHVGWQDRIHRLDETAIRADMDLAARSFLSAVGVAPSASAAPGWRTSPLALTVQDGRGLSYASDTRGDAPFRPSVGDGALATIQLPTTMPTMDEVIGRVANVPQVQAGDRRAQRPRHRLNRQRNGPRSRRHHLTPPSGRTRHARPSSSAPLRQKKRSRVSSENPATASPKASKGRRPPSGCG